MAVEVFQGVALGSPAGIKARWKAWNHHLAATDSTWRGGFAGITPQGRFLGVIDRTTISTTPTSEAAWSWASPGQLRAEGFVQSADVLSVSWRDGDREPPFVRMLQGTAADRRALDAERKRLLAFVSGGMWIWLSDRDFLALNGFPSADAARSADAQPQARELLELLAPTLHAQLFEPWYDDHALTYRRAEQLYQDSEQRKRAHRPRRVDA